MYSANIKTALIALLLIIASNAVIAGHYVISGKITGFKDATKVFLTDEEADVSIDSTLIKNGSFVLEGDDQDAPRYLSVELKENNHSYTTVVFLEGVVGIKGDKKDFPYNLYITGSREQQRYNKYQSSLKDLNTKADELLLAYEKAQGDSTAARKTAIAYNRVGNEIRSLKKRLIFSHFNSYYSVNELYGYLPDLSKDTIQRIYASLSVALKNSFYGKRLKTYIVLSDTLKINDGYFDFAAFDQFGVRRKISEIKDRYILLNFSTVHCEHCQDSMEELLVLADKYKKNVSVVTFSVDNQRDWLQGIKDNHISWLTLSDHKGNYSEPIIKYGVLGYPSFCLISPEGKIIDKWIGYEKLSGETGDIEQHIISKIKAL